MTRAELITLASPPCHQCEKPVQRVEFTHHRNTEGEWVPERAVMVCPAGHRVPVEEL